jgi:hypothetical protein
MEVLSANARQLMVTAMCFELSRIPVLDDQDIEDDLYSCTGDMLSLAVWTEGKPGHRCISPCRVLSTAKTFLETYGGRIPDGFDTLVRSFPTNVRV